MWQKGGGNRFLFFGDHNYWVIGPNCSANGGWITTVDKHLKRPPHAGWRSLNGSGESGQWIHDPHVKAEEDEGWLIINR